MILCDKGLFTLHTKNAAYQVKAGGYGVLLHTCRGPRVSGGLAYLIQYAHRGGVFMTTHAAPPFPALRCRVNGEGPCPGDVLMEAGWPVPWGDYPSMQSCLSAI